MDKIDWFQIIGGFGIFFISLRFLSNILGQSMASSIKSFLKKILNTRLRCFVYGFLVTIFVQASSITIITASGLLHTSLITLEQGFMIMLGATVGTTVKSWIFAVSIHKYGAFVVGICSIMLLFIKRPYARAIIEIVTAIGLAFLSLNILLQGFKPAIEDPIIRGLLQVENVNYLSVKLWVILVSCGITMMLQSSSAVIFIILEFVSQETMSFSTGAICILGANIGTTITPLIATIEYRRNVKRLAFAHVMIKVVGVLVTIFLFPFFLFFIDLIIPGSFSEHPLIHLAAVHTFFNLGNAIFWSFAMPLAIRLLFFFFPGREKFYVALSSSVRRMLAGNPQQAMKEVEKQSKQMDEMCKELTDYCLISLAEKQTQQYGYANTILMTRRFENIRETIYELLVKLNADEHTLLAQEKKYIDKKFLWLEDSTNFYHWSLMFKDHIERGIQMNAYEFMPEIQTNFQKYQQHFNELWILLLRNQPLVVNDGLTESLNSLKKIHLNAATQTKEMDSKLYWLYDTIRYLNKMIVMFCVFDKSTPK